MQKAFILCMTIDNGDFQMTQTQYTEIEIFLEGLNNIFSTRYEHVCMFTVRVEGKSIEDINFIKNCFILCFYLLKLQSMLDISMAWL